MERIKNRDRKCVICGESPVYAKYQCRRHYDMRAREEKAEARKLKVREKRERLKKERREANQHLLESEGSPCRVPSCATLTLSEEGLCYPHGVRARLWQFTPDEFVTIQNRGACEICGSSESLSLDHDHSLECKGHKAPQVGCPGCFRGLLCNGCNGAIGFMQDDPERLRAAAQYVIERATTP